MGNVFNPVVLLAAASFSATPCAAAASANTAATVNAEIDATESTAVQPTTVQSPAIESPAIDDPTVFKLSLTLEAWFPRLEGNFTDGPAEVDVRTPDLHDSEPTFAGALTLTRDRLSIAIRGFSFSTEGGGNASESFSLGGLSVGAGDAIDTSFSWWSAGAQVAYDVYRPLAAQTTPWSDPRADWTAPANNTDLSVFALASVDLQGIDRSLADLASGLVTDANETFFVAAAGVGFRLAFDTRSRIPLVRRVELGALAAGGVIAPLGGGELGFGARVEADLSAWFCNEGAVYFGYRYLGGTYEGEDMTLDGSLQGMRAGIRFVF